MRFVLALLIALAGCGAKKPAPKSAGSPVENKASDDKPMAPKPKADAPDADDAKPTSRPPTSTPTADSSRLPVSAALAVVTGVP